MATMSLPAISPESGLRRYLDQIKRFPMLEADQEYMLGKRWKEHEDADAAQQLVTSHLRLVAKIAFGYRGYGLSLAEIISEGNIGLMQAVKKFEPDKGFRLSTYAMWWIRASIQEYVLKSWSIVKVGTSATQKRLFFNLKKMKARLGAYEDHALTPEQLKEISEELNVPIKDIDAMNARMVGGDHSLNKKIGHESEDEWINLLADDDITQENALSQIQQSNIRHEALGTAMADLNEREQDIIALRKLSEPVVTLEELSQKYGVSRERIRQIETRAMEKLQSAMLPAPELEDA
ncbi:MAG: RNA polymerase sigma factor RpoH [Rickettsiales bacterium]|nr:RNA polymerase sigma factor RpoH [Rickettsiales bacterium]